MKTLVVTVLILLSLCSDLRAQSSPPSGNQAPLFVKVQLDSSVKLSSLKAGESVEGSLARDVYSPEDRVYASGSHIRLTVSRVERKRKTPSEKWPWFAKLFMPHLENSPVFDTAAISMPDGTSSAIQASLLSSNRTKEIRTPLSRGVRRKSENTALIDANRIDAPSATEAPAPHGPVLYLEAYRTGGEPKENSGWVRPNSSVASIAVAGTPCRVLLLNDISASKSHAGDEIHARLLEPIVSDSQVVIPAGSVFEGRVERAVRPKIPSRAGSLTITFDSLQLPEGHRVPVSASLAAVDVNESSSLRMDREGRLHGSRHGAMWMLINGGVAGGIAKEVDDGTQLIVEAIISTATDASTAGTARIAGMIVSAGFMLTRKGHDVVLPNHTEMAIMLNRTLTFSAQMAKIPSSEEQIRPRNRGSY